MSVKAYFLLRSDLGMSPAKLAVQVGHGVVIMSENLDKDQWKSWIRSSEMKKIILEVKTLEKLQNIYSKFHHEKFLKMDVKYRRDEIICKEIWDNGHTEFNGVKTLTGLVMFGSESDLSSYVKRLRLWK